MKLSIPKGSLLIVSMAALLLQACGGGGGDGNDNPPNPPQPTTYTLSGTIRPAGGAAIDNDVNDPNAAYKTNDSLADAQSIPNPVTLGGYVNQPGSGPDGRSRAAGDVTDYYRVSLLAGQQINLLIADDDDGDNLDLLLADLSGKIRDASVGQGRVETLTASADGDYLVVVKAIRGASNYVLTIGQALTPTGVGMRLSDNFVPGEAIVRFRDDATLPAAGLLAQAQAMGLTARAQGEAEERNRLINLAELKQMGIQAEPAVVGSRAYFDGLEPVDAVMREKLETLYLIKALQQDPAVAVAEPNYLRQPQFVPNDPLYGFQWHYPQLNLPQAWDVTKGAGAIVAVIDTGVVFGHPDLQGQFVPGYDFILNLANAGDGNGIDSDPGDPGDRANPGSSSFHGTHVTGTIVAVTNNGIGVAGVAFGAKVMPLRAIGRLGGTLYDIEQAVRFAAGLANDSGTVPARRADVINLSLGSDASSATEQQAYDLARAAGVVIVAAAGNQGNNTPFYPAAYPGVIGVSAVDIDKQLAPYSNFGPVVSVAAPGGNTGRDVNGDGKPDGILSTVANDSGGTLTYDYVIWQGTSLATPHVAGVVALMKAVAPNLNPQDVANLLASGALTEDLGAPGRDDQYGYGLINAFKAVNAAADSAGQPVNPTPILTVNPTALNFGINLNSQTLTVLNGGSGSLRVNSPTEDSGGWLSVSPAQTNADGTGTYTVAVRRDGLSEGVYRATITLDSTANTVSVSVIMQVASGLSTGSVGQQYVVLVNPDTGGRVANAVGQPQADGSQTITLRDVPAGTYQLFAGSDSNNDQIICDAGESCGAYLTLEAPVRIEIKGNLDNLDFVSGFVVNLANSRSAGAAVPETGIRRGLAKRLDTPR
jgi:serine protease